MHWTSSAVTDLGKVRSLNEDAFLDKPDCGVWVVADGMGGHDAGDLASKLIVQQLAQVPPVEDLDGFVDTVNCQLQRVNQQLQEMARQRSSLTTIGSTVVIMLVRERRFACIWAGDSRLYRLRHGVLEQITRDHSEVQALIDLGSLTREDAESHPLANVITRAIGAHEYLQPDVVYGELHSGDSFLLCSDGLYRELSDLDIAHSMQFDSVPQQVATNLVKLALERGARDNTTVLAINFVNAA